jgi:SOS-response transcriptional repressor LexA
MGAKYPSVLLGEVATVRSGFAFSSKDWTDGGVPVVKIGNVKDGRLDMNGCSFVNPGIAAQAAEFDLKAEDILIAMTGYIGDVAWVRPHDLPAVLNQRVGLFSIRDGSKLDRRFLFYLLRSSGIRAAIEGRGYGSAQPNVSPSLIHGVDVPLPPLTEQRGIAGTLGVLDDKIALNRRMNETLEAIARAIFKSWFVDFDPVRAKAEGRDSSLAKPLAALFPDSFEDSDLGEIPRGWKVGPLDRALVLQRGFDLPATQRTPGPHEEAIRIRDDVGFFQAIRGALVKIGAPSPTAEEALEHVLRQLVSRAVAPTGVMDIFAAAGLDKPDISILSDGFLAEVRAMPQRNLAVELLQRLLKDEIRTRSKKNVVQGKSFADLLEKAIRKYQNRAIETAQVIEELIALAKEVREAGRRGEDLGLTEDEVAFYDALETNDSAVKVLGDDTLKTIARELVESVRKNVSIDWTVRESARAKLRVVVKRILKKYGYPPDKQEKATDTVLQQAEQIGAMWAEEPMRAEPFERVSDSDAHYPNSVPLVSLKIAAGGFSDPQELEVEDWVRPKTTRSLKRGMFVAQVAGHSMEPMIPDGSWCLFASPVTGSRQGRIVLAQHRSIEDPETGGSYTVKRYRSEKETEAGGTWRHLAVILEPLNPAYQPIRIEPAEGDEVAAVAELLDVLWA